MPALNRSLADLEESLQGGEETLLFLGPVGASGILITVMQLPDGSIEVWKVTP